MKKPIHIETVNGVATLSLLPGKVWVLFDRRGTQLLAMPSELPEKTAKRIAQMTASDFLRVQETTDRTAYERGFSTGVALGRKEVRDEVQAATRLFFGPFLDSLADRVVDQAADRIGKGGAK